MNVKTDVKHASIIALKDLKQYFRKKEVLIPMYLFPLIMIVFFSYGMGNEINDASILIVNNDLGYESGPLISNLSNFVTKYNNDPLFSMTYSKDISQSTAESQVQKGIYKAVLIIPSDFSNNVHNNKSTDFILVTDAADVTTSQIIENIIKQFFNKPDSIKIVVPEIYDDLEYKDFLTPAIIGLVVFIGAISSSGTAIAGEKDSGTLIRTLMTPASKLSIILGKTLFQLVVQSSRVIILILFSFTILGFKINGSWLLVFLLLFIFTLCGVGLGMIMSSKTPDTESYNQVSMLVSMPSMFITGVFYPLDSMPSWMQVVAYLHPLTYSNNAMRAVMIKGQGLSDIYVEIIILTLFAIVSFIMGIKVFKRGD